MYLQGKGVARDEAMAYQWMQKKAANLGDAQAMSSVAISFEEGAGVARSDALALEWWRKAAGFGCGTAQATHLRCVCLRRINAPPHTRRGCSGYKKRQSATDLTLSFC